MHMECYIIGLPSLQLSYGPGEQKLDWSGTDGQGQAITYRYVGSSTLTESIDYEEIWSRVGGLSD